MRHDFEKITIIIKSDSFGNYSNAQNGNIG